VAFKEKIMIGKKKKFLGEEKKSALILIDFSPIFFKIVKF
jgi:hypothetical protein